MDVFKLRDHVVGEYKKYVTGFFKIADHEIERLVADELERGRLWPDPLIQLNPSFAPGPAMASLVADGLLHPDCLHIFARRADGAPPAPLNLYQHQVDAIHVARTRQPYVLTTGTGSGKSLSYILPIVHDILSQPKKPGVKAIIVYPMNALVNSQVLELTKYLGEDPAARPVSFAAYTGQQQGDRDQLKANPPDILLTNYVMMELMLTRPEEAALVRAAQGLRWLVLDELHTYRGRQGADVALLCRRLRASCAAPHLTVVGTSATLASGGSWDHQRAEIAATASKLFGAHVPPQHVIGETLVRATAPLTLPDELDALRSSLTLPAPKDLDALRAYPLARWIEATLGVREEQGRLVRCKPSSLDALTDQLAALLQLDDAARDAAKVALRATLLAGSKASETQRRLFAFRVHQFLSKGEAVWASLEPPASRYLTLTQQPFAPGDALTRRLYPLVFCRECGKEYYEVARLADDAFMPRADGEEQLDGFLCLDDPDAPWPADDEQELIARLPESWLTVSPRGQLTVRKDRRGQLPQPVHVTPLGAPGGQLRALWFPAPFMLCLGCGVAYAGRASDFAKLATLGSEGRSTATTILTSSAIRHISQDIEVDPIARKILSFTDNRQDASLQAGHFNDFSQIVRLRAALYRAVSTAGPQGHPYEQLPDAVVAALNLAPHEFRKEPEALAPGKRIRAHEALRGVVGYMIYKDLSRGWRITSPNLEQCGLLHIRYEDLDLLSTQGDLWAKTHPALQQASPQARYDVCQTLLDVMRRELAISVTYLTPGSPQNDLRDRSAQHLIAPWALHEERQLVWATYATSAPRRDEEQVGGDRHTLLHITPRSAFGLYLRRPGTLPSGLVTDLVQTQQVIDDLLRTLADFGQLCAGELGRLTTYQLDASMMRWLPGDGQQAAHDPVRLPRAPEAGLRTNPYFVQLYTAEQPAMLRAHEHTAQISSAQRIEREREFAAARLPVLFCSPTMELGVDISQLQLVNMRNVPPTPANYAQRSGRAGRSGQPALVLNYCTAGSPHDQHFFRNPQLMVSGEVAVPRLDLKNEELLRAHVHAVWLELSGVDLGKTLVDVLDLQATPAQRETFLHAVPALQDDRRAYLYPPQGHLRDALTRPALLRDAAQRARDLLRDVDLGELDLERWLDACLSQLLTEFARACLRWCELHEGAQSQLLTQNQILAHTTNQQDREEASRLHREANEQLKLLKDASRVAESDFYSYRYFASEGFLPGYNFPRLPLSAYLPGRKGPGQDEFLSRPRFLAISEFGPQSQIYHNGAVYSVHRVFIPAAPGQQPGQQRAMTRTAALCDACGALHPVLADAPPPDRCERCEAALPAPMRDLFRMQNVVARMRDRINSDEEERQRAGYAMRTAIQLSPHRLRAVQWRDEDGPLVALDYCAAARLWRVNMGWRRRPANAPPGFLLSVERGEWITDRAQERDERARTRAEEADQLVAPGRRIQRVVPYVEDHRNSLILRPDPELLRAVAAQTQTPTSALMAALDAAFKRAVQRVSQVEDRELVSESLPHAQRREAILLCEAAEGGAGVLEELLHPARLRAALREALVLCHFDPDTGEDLAPARCSSACYDCLLSYFNQPDHATLNRHALKPLLMRWLAAPDPAPVAQRATIQTHAAPLPARWLDAARQRGLLLPDRRDITLAGVSAPFAYSAIPCLILLGDAPSAAALGALDELGAAAIHFPHDEARWPALFAANAFVFSPA